MHNGNGWPNTVDPGHWGDQGRVIIKIFAQRIIPSISIFVKRSTAEIDLSADFRVIPDSMQLTGKLVPVPPICIRTGTENPQADITGPVKMIFAPPIQQNAKGSIFLFKFPI